MVQWCSGAATAADAGGSEKFINADRENARNLLKKICQFFVCDQSDNVGKESFLC